MIEEKIKDEDLEKEKRGNSPEEKIKDGSLEENETEEDGNSDKDKSGEKESNEVRNKQVSFNKVFIAVITVVLLVTAVMFFSSKTPINNTSTQLGVVAIVNGESISESDVTFQLQQVEKAFSAQGQVITDEIRTQMRLDTIDALIGQKLIFQEANRLGISVTDEDVNVKYTSEVLPLYDSEEVLEEALVSMGFTKEQALKDIKQQLIMELFIDKVISTEDIEITDEEARALYDETALRVENLPSFDTVIEEIKVSIYNQAVTEKIIVIVEELKAIADIEIK